jgi:resuscitation-promoting factor RpfB
MKKNNDIGETMTGWLVWLVVAGLALAGCTMAPATQSTVLVTIDADGKQVHVQIPEGSTAQVAVDAASITLNNLDRMDPPGFTLIKDGDTVQVTRVREVYTVEEVTIPFEKKTLNNETLPEGQTLLVQRGINGVEQLTYRQVLENDVEVSNIVFKNEIITEPLPEIIMVGVQKPFTPLPVPGKLAYLSGGSAWLMEITTGNRRPIVTTGDLDGRVFELSPKGDWLLFTRTEAPAAGNENQEETANINSLWAVDLLDENPKAVNLKVANIIHFADWVPGKGLTITYSTVEPRPTAPGWQANNDLQLLTFTPTGAILNQETILDSSAGGFYGWWGMDYAWSTDGSLLAYSRPDEVGLVDLENKTTRSIASILPYQTNSDWAWVPGIGWSPDSQVLYLTNHVPKAGMDSQEASPLFDLGGTVINMEELSGEGPLISIIAQAGMFAYPEASPMHDGYQVAFLQAIFPEQSDTKRYRLVVMDRDGSNQQTIFPKEDRLGLDPQQVAWSPQPFGLGNYWLAVQYQGNLWLVDSKTGDAQQVTGDGLLTHFDWK